MGQTEIKLLFSIVKSIILEEDVKNLYSNNGFESIFAMSKFHDIAPIVGFALDKSGVTLDSEVKQKFQKEQMLAVFRYEQQRYELEQISNIFEKEEIEFIPLKGSVIREFYPEKWLRTSCDIDILVKEKDLDKALKALREQLGYKQESKGSHDVSLSSPSNVHIELHYDLLEESFLNKANIPLKRVWDYTVSKEDKTYHKLLTNEMFYYYHIAHMAKHYVVGGCGVRPFLDLVFVNANMSFDKAKRNEILSLGGLDKFAEQAENLSEVWFSDREHTEITKQMEDYILKAGVYGNVANRVAVQQVKKGGKFKYLLSRIWMPYDVIKFQYPVLQKHKWLLLFCQVRRWFRLFLKGRLKRSINEAKTNNNLNEQTQNSTLEMIKKLGLE